MYMQFIFLVAGLVGLWYFADVVVARAVKVAEAMNITHAFIGLTIISIGTSMPELIATIISSISVLKGVDASALALSTNIGSDIVQLTLILGLVSLFSHVYTHKKILYSDYIIMTGAMLLIFIFALSGEITRFEGFILLACYGVYLYTLVRKESIFAKTRKHINYVDLIYLVAALALLVYSGKLVVDSSLWFSQTMAIDQTFFGSFIIAFSTSLPELSTAFQGFRRKSHGLSLGVMIGSNIANPLLNIGMGALISGYLVSKEVMLVDLPFFFGVAIIAFVFFHSQWRITKKEAGLLLTLYMVYIFLKFRLLFT